MTQKTAWFMLQRIRLAMQDDDSGGKIGGDVEVDETYIGGKARNMHKSQARARSACRRATSMAGKVAVMGLLERHGRTAAARSACKSSTGRKRSTCSRPSREHVEAGLDVYTDALRSYRRAGQRDYMHNVIDHAEKYVDGQVHTNGCENYWSLLKRALKGTYVSVEPFHLFRYLDEQAFRFNNRGHERRGTVQRWS